MSDGFSDPENEKKLKAAQLLLDKVYTRMRDLEKSMGKI